MIDRPLVYVAAPYAHPDPVVNTRKAILAGDELNATGKCVAFVPHLSMLWHLACPHEEDYWYALDLAYLARCDVLYRIPGTSKGADMEVAFAQARGIPVFRDRSDLLNWLEMKVDVGANQSAEDLEERASRALDQLRELPGTMRSIVASGLSATDPAALDDLVRVWAMAIDATLAADPQPAAGEEGNG